MEPILPPQRQGVLDGVIFNDIWYLYLQSLNGAVTGGAIVQYGTRAERLLADVAELLDGTAWVETDTGLIYQWHQGALDWNFAAGIMVATFASRPGSLGKSDTGALFFAKDTFALYQWSGTAWSLFTQVYQRTQAQLAALAATLGTTDAGLLVDVTDYGHVLQWTGTAWQWGPGEAGSGMLQFFAVAPTGAGWHGCDGSTVPYLKSDGTTATKTLPNTNATAAYPQAGAAYNPAITAAVAPTISAPVFTGTPGNTGAASAGAQGSGATANTLTQIIHTHSFTPAGTVSAPTATLGGDPIANFEAILYFRQ